MPRSAEQHVDPVAGLQEATATAIIRADEGGDDDGALFALEVVHCCESQRARDLRLPPNDWSLLFGNLCIGSREIQDIAVADDDLELTIEAAPKQLELSDVRCQHDDLLRTVVAVLT